VYDLGRSMNFYISTELLLYGRCKVCMHKPPFKSACISFIVDVHTQTYSQLNILMAVFIIEYFLCYWEEEEDLGYALCI